MGSGRLCRAVVLAFFVLAGCSSGSDGFGTEAEQLCRKAVTGNLVSSDATTVAALRRNSMGTSTPEPVRDFPQFADGDFAAWCWTESGGTYTAYGVTSDGIPVQEIGGLTISADQAHGQPPGPP